MKNLLLLAAVSLVIFSACYYVPRDQLAAYKLRQEQRKISDSLYNLFTSSSSSPGSSFTDLDTIIRAGILGINKPYSIMCNSDSTRLTFTLKKEDTLNGRNRNELKIKSGYSTSYKFAFYVKKFDYRRDSGFFDIANWHPDSTEDKIEGLFSGLAIQLTDTSILFYNRASVYVGDIHDMERVDTSINRMLSFTEPLLKEAWNTVEVHVRWAQDNTGMLVVKINGHTHAFKDVRTLYELLHPFFWQVGIYRGKWFANTATVKYRNIQVDGLKVVPDFLAKTRAGE